MPHSKPTSGGRSGSAGTFDRLKEFEGRRYTGMRVGRRHKSYYDEGEWNETKVTPDRWQFTYEVTKRRAGHAPDRDRRG